MNPSDDFVMEEKALKLLASLHELTSLNDGVKFFL